MVYVYYFYRTGNGSHSYAVSFIVHALINIASLIPLLYILQYLYQNGEWQPKSGDPPAWNLLASYSSM